MNIKSDPGGCRKANTIAADYMPTTEKSVDSMYEELRGIYHVKVSNPVSESRHWNYYFVKDEDIYLQNSKVILLRRRYITGLPEDFWNIHLSVVKFCDYMAGAYHSILNQDLLLTAAICPRYRKSTKELSCISRKMITQTKDSLLGHIVIGVEMIG